MEYKIIKLHNGDDLISGVTRYNPDDDTKPTIALEDPYCLKQVATKNEDDHSVAFVRWIPFTDDELILLPLDRVVTMTSVKSDLLSYYIKLSEKHKLTEHSTFAEAELEEGYEDDDEDYLSKLESASNSTIH
mgnify:FL=1